MLNNPHRVEKRLRPPLDDRDSVRRGTYRVIYRPSGRGWRWPLDRPGRWTPLFFLDDAVALAAGHRPCATCRRPDYSAYRDAATATLTVGKPLLAAEINAILHSQRHERGRGLNRAADRKLLSLAYPALPDGTVVLDDDHAARLITGSTWRRFPFTGWNNPTSRPEPAWLRCSPHPRPWRRSPVATSQCCI